MSWIKGTKVVALRRPDTDRFLQLQRLGDRTMLWVAPPATGKDNVLFAVSSSGLYDGRQEELTALQVAKHIPVPKSVLEKATRHPGLVRAFVAGEQLDR